MVKVIVDRRKWLRGEGKPDMGKESSSKLLRSSDMKMCCLGFYCKTKGLTDEQILDIGSPMFARSEWDKLSETLIVISGHRSSYNYAHKNETNVLMEINDSADLTDNARETAIIIVGKEIGIEFEFVDENEGSIDA